MRMIMRVSVMMRLTVIMRVSVVMRMSMRMAKFIRNYLFKLTMIVFNLWGCFCMKIW